MPDINGLSFGSTIDTLGNALTGAAMQNQQIANNIANANTPGFHRSAVVKETFRSRRRPAGVPLAACQRRSPVPVGQATSPVPFDPQPQTDVR